MIPTRLTAKRRAWLERLRDHGPAERDRSNVGYACHHAGWTEWAYRIKETGEYLGLDELSQRFPKPYWDHVRTAGERITEAGRKVLEQ